MTEAEFAGMVDGVLACVRHDPEVETKGAEAVAREHILNGLRHAHAAGLEEAANEALALSMVARGGTEGEVRGWDAACNEAYDRIRALAAPSSTKET